MGNGSIGKSNERRLRTISDLKANNTYTIKNKVKWRKKKPKLPYNESDGIVKKLTAINGIEDIKRFMYPTSAELHNPYLLKNIMTASKRILESLQRNEFITIHADIDADGATACAVMFNYLKQHTNKIKYIHAQRSEGHGVTKSINDIPPETELLIVVDSSSNEVETSKRIRKMGIDLIIIDHHEVTAKNDYCILVNPMQEGCEYPNKNTSGSLICWKVTQVLDDQLGDDSSEYLVDLAGTGLHSDQCSMLEPENRYILSQALSRLHNSGLKAIIQVMGKETNNLSSSDFAYSLTPFINAVARFDKMEKNMELLTTDNLSTCVELAKDIKKLNDERKVKQADAVKRLVPLGNLNDKCMVFIDNSLGKSFNGLIAQDLASYFNRPVIVFGETEDNPDEYHGSFRSVGFFDFLEFTHTLPEIINSGGHPGAGGVGIKKADLEKFKKSLNEGLTNENFEQVVSYDLEIDLDDLTEDFIKEVKKLYHISGKHVSEAKFLVRDLFSINKKSMAKNTTLKVGLCSAAETWFIDESEYDELEPKVDALKFRTNEEYIEAFPVHKTVDVVSSVSINEWFNPRTRKIQKTLQLFLEDYRESQIKI